MWDLTSVLDPNVLPPYVVADLYRQRWRIEDAFNIVKRYPLNISGKELFKHP